MCQVLDPVRATDRNFYSIPKKPNPFDTVHIDHLGPLPSLISKRKYLLLVIDAFTKYVKLYPVNSTSTKEVNASLGKWSGGTCKSGQHADVGKIKRACKSCESLMLRQVEYALNNSIHTTTKRMPSELLFGVSQRGQVIDELTEYLEDKVDKVLDLSEIRSEASKAIDRSQGYSTNRAQLRNKPAKTYEIGDFVVIMNVDTTVGKNKKLNPKYRGPYVKLGHNRYVIRDVENCQLTQLPYDGVVEANRIRKWILPLTSEVNRTVEKCNIEAGEENEGARSAEEDDSLLPDERDTLEMMSDEEFAGFDESDLIMSDRVDRMSDRPSC